jgi:hypothetical protein
VGLGVTAVLGTATALSGVDTVNRHVAFMENPSEASAHAGENAQIRTQVLIGSTAVVAVATTIAGVFFVRWSDARER